MSHATLTTAIEPAPAPSRLEPVPVSRGRSVPGFPQNHLFVVGFFRSGTSLLYSLLNLHSRIKLLYEADILGTRLLDAPSWAGSQWWETLDFFNGTLRRHDLSPRLDWVGARSIRRQADLIYQQFAGTEATYIGEKCPSYYNRLPILAGLYPKARFILIWRHPQAIISSLAKAARQNTFFRQRSLHLRSIIGFEKMQRDAIALRRQGHSVFDLCYEELVADPERMLRSICAFLDLPFEPGMLHLEEADLRMLPEGEHHRTLKSGSISRTAHAPDPALEPMQAKAQRYLARWRDLFGNSLASQRYWSEAHETKPDLLERAGDRARYRSTCLWRENIIPLVYGRVPITLLQEYRRARGRTVQ
jgi:hypothetical protein